MPRKPRSSGHNNDRARLLVAQEAARIIVNHGIRDYRIAKQKAAQKLGLDARRSLPGNAEVERALSEHHSLFGGESHADVLLEMREAALSAMQILAAYSPRLVGPVLNGTADENSAVNLHVFSDHAEAVAATLGERDIPYRSYERRLRSRRDRVDVYAGFEFGVHSAAIQATVFPVDGIRQAPLSPIDGRPMERADEERVRTLIGAASGA